MMRVTTFLKNWRKGRLLRRIDELEKFSAQCLEKSRAFQVCFNHVQSYPNLYQSYFCSYWNMNCCYDLYTQFYNDYLHFLRMHERTESKIRNLKRKLEQL